MDDLSIRYLLMESVISVFSVLGNGLVLLAIYRTPALRTVTNCFIGSLALADFLVGIALVPYAKLVIKEWPFNFIGCLLINSSIFIFTQVSIFSLLAIAIERYIAIKYPFIYENYITIFRSIVVLIITWILAVVVVVLQIISTNAKPCLIFGIIKPVYLVFVVFMGLMLVPLIIMGGIYIYIFFVVRFQMYSLLALNITDARKKKHRLISDLNAAKYLALSLALFAFSWLPVHIYVCYLFFCKELELQFSYSMWTVFTCLSHANSVFNPLLYAYANSKFKTAFRKMSCCLARTEDKDSDNALHQPIHFMPKTQSLYVTSEEVQESISLSNISDELT